MNPAVRTADVAVSRQNYGFTYNKISDYNGLAAYVFLLKPRRKRVGLFRGELWLTTDTGAPLRLWGDLVKSPSIFIRSFRFVQDYPTAAECSQPLRLMLTIHTRIAGTVDMVVWQQSAADSPDSTGRRREWFSISARRSSAKMTVETARDIAKKEPQKGVNGSNGTRARRFAVHELPIPGAADSLRKALRDRASSPAGVLPSPGIRRTAAMGSPTASRGTATTHRAGSGGCSNRPCGGSTESPAASRISPCRPPGRRQSSPASSKTNRFSSHHYGWIDRCRALTLAAGRNAAPFPALHPR